MNGWWIILIAATVVSLYPFWRFFFKRMIMWIKLKRACRKCGARLRGTHFLWMFACRERQGCDCIIERCGEIYEIKLFATYRRACHVIFTENNKYIVRHFLALFGYYQKLVMPMDKKPRKLPSFRLKKRDGNEEKPKKRILLIHPICMQIRYGREETPLFDGDKVNDATLLSLAGLLRILVK